MRPLLVLAVRSAWHRRFVLALVVISMALSTFLLLGIERLRADLREHFAQSVSGTDLIVGARTSDVQLLLQAVFHLGNATAPLRWRSVQTLAQHPAVAWTVPLSLGDTHRGFAVVATTGDFFQHFRYGDAQPLVLAQGQPFKEVFDAVLGADVAQHLGCRLGDSVVLSHGDGLMAEHDHDDKPFTVTGILQRTGTPVDRSVHIALQGLEAVHLDWRTGTRLPGLSIPAAEVGQHDLTPKKVSAVLIGLHHRAAVLSVQRMVADFSAEPLMAVLPGVALDELWQVVDVGERALQAISGLVSLVSLAGLVAVILAGLNERRRELALLRAVGASPHHLLLLLAAEGTLVTLCGMVLGGLTCVLAVVTLGGWSLAHWGVPLRLQAPSAQEGLLLAGVLAAGVLSSLVPGLRAYQLALADGLSPRI